MPTEDENTENTENTEVEDTEEVDTTEDTSDTGDQVQELTARIAELEAANAALLKRNGELIAENHEHMRRAGDGNTVADGDDDADNDGIMSLFDTDEN